MDHRVLAHVGGDLSRVNVHPRARGRMGVTARVGVSGKRVGPVGPVGTVGTGSAGGARIEAGVSVGPHAHVVAARCPGCGYRYDVAKGDPREGLTAGTPWSRIEPDLECPDCGVRTASEFVLETAAP